MQPFGLVLSSMISNTIQGTSYDSSFIGKTKQAQCSSSVLVEACKPWKARIRTIGSAQHLNKKFSLIDAPHETPSQNIASELGGVPSLKL